MHGVAWSTRDRLLEPHSEEDGRPTRVMMQRPEASARLQVCQAGVAPCKGSVQPLGRPVRVAPDREHLGNLDRPQRGMLTDQLLQCGVGRRVFPTDTVRDCRRPEPASDLRLLRGRGQRVIHPASRQDGEREVGARRDPVRRELEGLPKCLLRARQVVD